MTLSEFLLTLTWLKIFPDPLFVNSFELQLKEQISNKKDFQEWVFKIGSQLIISDRQFEKIKDELDLHRKMNLNIVTQFNSNFPQNFRRLERCPVAFATQGQLSSDQQQAPYFTIIGSRNPDPQLVEWASFHLCEFFKNREVKVVSGGARGFDQLAHRLSIESSLATVIWLPSGLNEKYPHSIASLSKDILVHGGCFASVYPPSLKMYKSHFVERNHLVVAMSKTLLVLQAQLRSGTAMSAKIAMNIGNEVAVCPGSVWNQKFAGNLSILKDGATLITDAQDLITLMDRIY